jgi:hypothetical protein
MMILINYGTYSSTVSWVVVDESLVNPAYRTKRGSGAGKVYGKWWWYFI